MKVIESKQTHVTLEMSRHELATLNNALNEVANGVRIDDREFETRMGSDRAAAQALLEALQALLRSGD
jgi:hypothetical protein